MKSALNIFELTVRNTLLRTVNIDELWLSPPISNVSRNTWSGAIHRLRQTAIDSGSPSSDVRGHAVKFFCDSLRNCGHIAKVENIMKSSQNS
eukprot:327577-Pleurochrysis_carterae.AAC.2